MKRRHVLLLAVCLSFSSIALAQSKVTRIIVAFTAGGPVDLVARTIAEQLGKELGRTVIVENKPGANGAIGAQEVMRSAPDGTTLWLTSVGAVAINPVLYDKLAYDMQRDFAPVSVVVNNDELLATSPANTAKDAAEFVAAIKNHPDAVPMASSGIGSIPHLAIEQLKDATGAKILHIPYKGAAPAITDVMGGQVAGWFGDVPGMIAYIKSGKLKALAMAAKKRHPALPSVPTLDELGIKGVDTNNWYALFVSSKTPPEIVDQLNRAVRNTLNVPVVRDKLIAFGAEPAPTSPQELAAILRADTEKWGKLIKAKNIKAE